MVRIRLPKLDPLFFSEQPVENDEANLQITFFPLGDLSLQLLGHVLTRRGFPDTK